MQVILPSNAGTVSTLWLRGRSWGFKIHFWRNTVYFFWKAYICSNKLDVKETNCCFSQFNWIWNHLFGRWIEIRLVACSGVMGFYCFCLWKHDSYYRKNGATCWQWKKTNVKGRSTFWIILIAFPPTSNLLIRKPRCMCLKTMKRWSRWSLKEGVPQWDMFPEPTELLLIGCSIESIWIPKSKSSTSTPKTNSQTSSPREISHVMSGTVFCADSTWAISVLQFVPEWCRKNTKRFRWRKSHRKVETDHEFGLAMQWKDSSRSIFYCIRKPGGNQTRKSNSSESANTEVRLERGDPLLAHSTRTNSLLKTMRRTLTPEQNQNCR